VIDPRRDIFHTQVHEVRAAARALIAPLSHSQLNWQPEPTRWSVGQNLQHVVLTGREYLARLDDGIDEARRRTRAHQRPHRPGLLAAYLVKSMEPPITWRMRTLPRLQPPSTIERDMLLAEFDAFHQELARRIYAAADAHLDCGRLRSPILPVIRLTVEQALAVLLAHARRHLWTANRLRELPAFPRE
jgi:hypothetical protein